MDRLEITAQPRNVFGKKAHQLRQKGLVPGNVYGHGNASFPIQVDAKDLASALAHAGTSRLISLRLPAEREPRRVLVREVDRNPVTYQVKMTEKLRAEISLLYVGEAPAASGEQGVQARSMNSIEVECLPADFPESIRVDLSRLETTDDAIHVRDLEVPGAVTVLTDPEELVAKVMPLRVEREEEAVAAAPPREVLEVAEEQQEEATA